MEQQLTDHKKIDDEMRNIIEEARVIPPGVQALFGFQTIVVGRNVVRVAKPWARARQGALTELLLMGGVVCKSAAPSRQRQTDIRTGRHWQPEVLVSGGS
jgi:hypothetical protein